jgi:hypothetical protein
MFHRLPLLKALNGYRKKGLDASIVSERNNGIERRECSNRPKGFIFKQKAFTEYEIYKVPERICKGFFINRLTGRLSACLG